MTDPKKPDTHLHVLANTSDRTAIVAKCGDGGVEIREALRLQDGKPIPPGLGELYAQDAHGDWLSRGTVGTTHGPAQVATDGYRDGWARTFGGRATTVGLA